MNGENQNINPWDEKLELLTLPEINDSWEGMQALLDKNMPIVNRRDLRRWVLLIAMLLLLIGVCNCPGGFQVNRNSKNLEKIQPKILNSQDSTSGQSGQIKTFPEKKPFRDQNYPKPEKSLSNIEATAEQVGRNSQRLKRDMGNQGTDSGQRTSYQQSAIALNAKPTHKKNLRVYDPSQQKPQTDKVEEAVSGKFEVEKTRNSTQAPILKTIDLKKDTRNDLRPNQSTDSAVNTHRKSSTKEDLGKGWEFGVGLNQFFPVDQQQNSDFNSNGTSGSLSDYIPVPMARYYFNKKWYVQAEAEINSPQYTKNILASQDSSNGPSGSLYQNSVYIRKLFYFNLPLSIHYSLIRHFYVGTGLQFSSLTNGVALFEQIAVPTSTGSDTLESAKVQGFKNSPVYKKLITTEWRFLFDVNYQFKPISFGIRYNQAFTDYLNIHISNTQVTQARNRSLQLYLRYRIWKTRKKITTVLY